MLAAGKKDAALRAFRAALEMAARADVVAAGVAGLPRRPAGPPLRPADRRPARRRRPRDGRFRRLVVQGLGRRLAPRDGRGGRSPPGSSASRAAPTPRAALDAALAEAEADAAADDSPTAEAVRLAAGAEALAMKQRWADARDRYRRAIDLMPVELVRRAWWFNLADLVVAARRGRRSGRRRWKPPRWPT